MRRLLTILLILTFALPTWPQSTVGRKVDQGPTLPSTCKVGQIYFQTVTATVGLYQCATANTWTAAGGGVITGTDTQLLFFDGNNNPAGDADLVWDKTNNYLTGPIRIRFGGTTSSFPMLKRNSAALETKLADDSAYAVHNALSFAAQGINGGYDGTEGDCSNLTVASGHDLFCPHSTYKAMMLSNNNGNFNPAMSVGDRSIFWMHDEFPHNSNSDRAIGELTWGLDTFTANTVTNLAPPDALHFGILQMTSGAGAGQGGGIEFKQGNVGMLPDMSTTTKWEMIWIFKNASAANTDLQIYVGMFGVNGGTCRPNNFIGVKFDTTAGTGDSDTNWEYATRNAGTATTSDSTVAVDTNWHWVRIRNDGTAGTIKISINGGAEGVLSTNVPNGNLTPGVIFCSATGGGGAAKIMQIDYFSLWFSGLAR